MIEPSSEHREALEAELLAQFDRRHPQADPARFARRRHARLAALGAAAVLAIGILAASRAPADYGLALGQRIEIKAAPGTQLPDGQQLGRWIEEGLQPELGRERQLEVRLQRAPDGAISLRVDLWGAPIAGVVDSLRAHVPALAQARIEVTPLSGRVHTNLAGLLEHELLHRHDAAAREALRRKLSLQVGKGSDVDVQIDETPEGRERVRIKIETREGAEADGGSSTPL